MKKALIIVPICLLLAFVANAKVPEGDPLAGVRPGPDGKIDVITIFPHQDDETIFVGGTILKMKTDPAVRVHIMCMTLGDLSSAKEQLKISPELQGRIRVKELEAAAAVLGADEVIQLDYHDQGLAGADQQELRKKILDAIEKTGAEVVFTYGPDGMSGHIDHQTLSKAVTEVFPKSKAQKLYYPAVPKSLGPLYKAFNKVGFTEADIAVNTKPFQKLKKLAMYEHATQKFFSGPFTSPNIETMYDHEWFKLAATNK